MDEVEGVGSMAYNKQSFISLWLTSVHSPSGVARSQTEFYRQSYHGNSQEERKRENREY
jgi:hypothetical protein